jgi:hypothetical protein
METEDTLVNFSLTRGPIRGKDRNKIGLIVRVKARRDVEEFMSNLAQGRRMPVDAMGDVWQNCNEDGAPLEYYETDNRFESNRHYSLDFVSGPLLVQPNAGSSRLSLNTEEVVNLAFLRLAGISMDSGVSIGLAGAYSNDYIKRVKLALPGAVKQFLQDYIVPVTLNLQVIARS